MAVVHNLKIRPEYYVSVVDGSKSFEVRKNDRDFHVGDFLILAEYVNGYTGRAVKALVTYLLRDSCYVKVGYVIMGIKRV
jgi:hypothetical protein